jgi:hypothetical protein
MKKCRRRATLDAVGWGFTGGEAPRKKSVRIYTQTCTYLLL